MTIGFDAEWLARADEVPAEVWTEGFAPPLESLWWYRALEDSRLDDQFRFRYLVLRQAGAVVAMAPTFVMDVPMDLVVPPELLPWVRAFGRVLPWLRAQRTLFVGSPCAEQGHVALMPGADRGAALQAIDDELCREMRRQGVALRVWKDFRADWGAELGALAARAGLFRLVSFPGTEVHWPLPTRDSYFESLGGNQRHQLKKKLRRSAAEVDLQVEWLRGPDPATLDELFALFWQTYERATTKFERLNREFFGQISAAPVAGFIVLREASTGAAVAFMLCFEFKGWLVNKFIGIDYRRPKEWLLYFKLWAAALDHASASGIHGIQSGQTGYRPKLDLGHRLVPLTNFCAHRNPLVHRVYAKVAKTVSWATLDPALAAGVSAHPELLGDCDPQPPLKSERRERMAVPATAATDAR
jgi:hypothetical protein